MEGPILQVDHLQVEFQKDGRRILGADDVSFAVHQGRNLALVGESGSGKSVSSLACVHLLDTNGRISRGKVFFRGQDITRASEKEMSGIRGNRVSMIFQEPMTSLNPVLSVGFQVGEALRLHTRLPGQEIRRRSLELLEQMRIPGADKILKKYPHELSGGMRQRVMIAMALACDPELLIADEPTTALDVTVQAQILQLLRQLQEETGITILLITHDFGIVAEMAEEVVVMYAGMVVEQGDVREIFRHPAHPYTEGLLRSIIPLDASLGQRLYSIPGTIPEVTEEQSCCPFHDRCPYASEKCREALPAMQEISPGHFFRCFLGGRHG